MTQEVARLADVAMFTAEPDPTAGVGLTVQPRVTLLTQTPDPLRVMAAACEMYIGHVVRSHYDVPEQLALDWLHDMTQTKNQTPLELIDFHFLIEGVSRAFTHQLVRQRVGATYIQESMRFGVKENAALEVALPPSLDHPGADKGWRQQWDDAVRFVADTYTRLVAAGMPAEDARGLLPTNITTRVHYKTTLRGLADHAGMRLCSQAQYEWKLVWRQIVNAIIQYGPTVDRWQQRAMVSLFKPVCFATGKCEFMGATDRWCVIRERVQAHAANGDPPNTWSDINPMEPLQDGAARLSPEMADGYDK